MYICPAIWWIIIMDFLRIAVGRNDVITLVTAYDDPEAVDDKTNPISHNPTHAHLYNSARYIPLLGQQRHYR